MARKLFVGNLSYDVGEAELQALFEQAGVVETVSIVRDRDTGRPRGFAFVEMGSEEGARKASADFNDYEFHGRRLAVNEARPRPERPPGGGGGGRRFGGGGGGGGGRGGRGRREPRW